MRKIPQFLVYALIFSINWMALTGPASATMIGSEALVQASQRDATEAKVLQALSRPALVQQMEKLGVDPAAARDRVAALTDAELAALDQRLDSLPAGGDIVGALLFVFVLLLVTDILGLTKVFPFTRARR
ncbi:MAG: hypothetical protein RL404_787 [Pseudomonadota bacterium]